MKRLLALWEALPPEWRQKILDHYSWVIVVVILAVVVGYFTVCRCQKADGQTPLPTPAASRSATEEAAYQLALDRARARAAEKARRKALCPDSCGCGRCDEGCKCLSTAKPCGPGCSCVVGAEPAVEERTPGGKTVYFGVDTDKVSESRSYRICDGASAPKEVTRSRAIGEMGEAGIPDDAHKLRLTVIGSEADCKRVLDDLKSHPALTPFRDLLVIQDYRPDQWAVADGGFKTSGSPVIYLQTPGVKKPRHRQDEYRGPEKLAEAIRNADPNYKPELDPDLNKTGGGALLDKLKALPPVAWILGGLAVLFLFRKGGAS